MLENEQNKSIIEKPIQLKNRQFLSFKHNNNLNIESSHLSVLSYNILAPSTVEQYLYPNTEPKFLESTIRFDSVIKEIIYINSDISFLQELDYNQIESLTEKLKYQNYEIIYNKKNSIEKNDGCGIIYKKDKFNKIGNWFCNLKMEANQNYGNEDLFSKEMYYPSIGQFLLLEDNKYNKKILCVNTHLLFNKNKGHVKLAMLLLIFKIINILKSQIAKVASLIFSGDFNIVPNSMLYNWLSGNGINLSVDLREFSNQSFFMSLSDSRTPNEIALWSNKKYKNRNNGKNVVLNSFLLLLMNVVPIITNENQIIFDQNKNEKNVYLDPRNEASKNFDEIINKLQICSCYSKFLSRPENNNYNNESNNEALITHFTKDVRSATDYIWINKDSFKVKEILNIPEFGCFGNNEKIGLPNEIYPSDHLLISVKLDYKDDNEDI